MSMARWYLGVVMGCGALAAAGVMAQVARDPTVPPPEALAAPGTVVSDSPWGGEGMAVVTRDGQLFLVSGTRLYGVGQKIGAFRIERISETEVWLRNGKELRKVPRFSGIVRKPAAESKGSKP